MSTSCSGSWSPRPRTPSCGRGTGTTPGSASATTDAVLYVIESNGGSATPVEISRRLLRELHSVTEMLKRMEADGLITRETTSGRSRIEAGITEKGTDVFNRSLLIETDKRVFSVLTKRERERLMASLTKIRSRSSRTSASPSGTSMSRLVLWHRTSREATNRSAGGRAGRSQSFVRSRIASAVRFMLSNAGHRHPPRTWTSLSGCPAARRRPSVSPGGLRLCLHGGAGRAGPGLRASALRRAGGSGRGGARGKRGRAGLRSRAGLMLTVAKPPHAALVSTAS